MHARSAIAAAALLIGAAMPITVQAHRAASQFTVNVTIMPAKPAAGGNEVLQAHTRIGSMCGASVAYDNGARVASLAPARQHVGQSGIVRWQWQAQTAASGGTASVVCTFKGQTRSGHVRFTVAHIGRPAARAGSPPRAPVSPSVGEGMLRVRVQVAPNPIPVGAYPTVTIATGPRAKCDISVYYSTGPSPTSYPEHQATADGHGTIVEHGRWHTERKGTRGMVGAYCTLGNATGSGGASFTIG